MTIRRLGYACINSTLGGENVPKKQRVSTNRTCRLATAKDKGISHIASLVYANVTDLLSILQWNESQGIRLFRMSSEMIPFLSHPEFAYSIDDLDEYHPVSEALAAIGKFVSAHDHRLSFHPGPFNVLASPHADVVVKAIRELNATADLCDRMGLPANHNCKINIHVGGAYGEPDQALARFCRNAYRLSASALSRLTVENDDRASLYSVADLYEHVFKNTSIPIVFDYHHHQFCTGGLSEQQALELAISTWPDDIVPTVHYSESHELHVGNDKPTPKHSVLINAIPDTYGNIIDVMVEAKGKELAILPYMGLEYKE
jgi:UV DNA damage endonuclease